jgi:3-methyladenine DNA glycosylase/8-oxoguanine DNA glycosylase
MCASGLRIHPDADHAEIRHRLLQLRGIGPWTVEYLAVRVLGDRDAFPAGDLVLRRALGGVASTEAAKLSQRWQPYRAYALFHLWSGFLPGATR